jgi:hypothetical protein
LKRFIAYIFFSLVFVATYSQVIYGEYINLTDTLIIKPDNKVQLRTQNFVRIGILIDSTVIFNNNDTLTFIEYVGYRKNKKDTIKLYVLKPNLKSCNFDVPAYSIQKEFWQNGKIKIDYSIKFLKKTGYTKHGKTKYFDENGNLIEIRKYYKGRLYDIDSKL